MPEPDAMFRVQRKKPQKAGKEQAQDRGGHSAPRAWKRDYCFGCGPANPVGLRLSFDLSRAGDSYIAEFKLAAQFGGPPGHAHGGIIATILDEAMNKANKLQSRVALTRRIEVEYLRPVPLGRPLVVEGWIGSVRKRASYNRAEIRNSEGMVLARGRGKFLVVDAQKMFSRELEEERREAEHRRNSPTQAEEA